MKQYPGKNSIWILDGARIHVDSNMVRYFRSLGILFVFLPAYCPHMNLIEILVGLIKQMFKRFYNSMDYNGIKVFVLEILMKFTSFNAVNIFKKCGYHPGGRFLAKYEPNYYTTIGMKTKFYLLQHKKQDIEVFNWVK